MLLQHCVLRRKVMAQISFGHNLPVGADQALPLFLLSSCGAQSLETLQFRCEWQRTRFTANPPALVGINQALLLFF